MLLSDVKDILLVHLPKQTNLFIRKSGLFCHFQKLAVARMFLKKLLHLNDMRKLLKKERINGRNRVNAVNITAKAQHLGDGIDTVISANLNIIEQLRFRHIIEFCVIQVKKSDLKRTNSFQKAFLYSSSDAHDFAGCFHLGRE